MSDDRIKIIERAKRIVIKAGSGLLTGENGESFFKQLAHEVAQMHESGIKTVLVSSGAIATGMGVLKINNRPKAIAQKQAVAAVGQPVLMQAYSTVFKQHGLKAAQILVTRGDLEHKTRFENAHHAMEEIFKFGVLPIVNENDTVAVEEIQFGDNDQLSAMVAHLIKADLLVILTDVDGLYDKDPHKNKSAKRFEIVKKLTKKIVECASETSSQVSTGGMITKLEAAKKAASYGIPTWIIKGVDLRRMLQGENVGTLFLPSSKTKAKK